MSVTGIAALEEPIGVLGKARLVGEKRTVEVAAPVSPMGCGLLGALSVTKSVADSAAEVEGVYLPWIVQLEPAFTVMGTAPQVPPATSVKSAAFAPPIIRPVMTSWVSPVSESVRITGALEEPCAWLPKTTGMGDG